MKWRTWNGTNQKTISEACIFERSWEIIIGHSYVVSWKFAKPNQQIQFAPKQLFFHQESMVAKIRLPITDHNYSILAGMLLEFMMSWKSHLLVSETLMWERSVMVGGIWFVRFSWKTCVPLLTQNWFKLWWFVLFWSHSDIFSNENLEIKLLCIKNKIFFSCSVSFKHFNFEFGISIRNILAYISERYMSKIEDYSRTITYRFYLCTVRNGSCPTTNF